MQWKSITKILQRKFLVVFGRIQTWNSKFVAKFKWTEKKWICFTKTLKKRKYSVREC